MEDRDILVCAPVSPGAGTVRGSITSACSSCGSAVWVAPSGQKIMDSMDVLCIPCAMVEMAASDEPIEHKIAPGAIDELIEVMGGGSPN